MDTLTFFLENPSIAYVMAGLIIGIFIIMAHLYSHIINLREENAVFRADLSNLAHRFDRMLSSQESLVSELKASLLRIEDKIDRKVDKDGR